MYDMSQTGLTSEEAEKRLQKYRKNEIKQTHKINPAKIFINQFTSPPVLIAAAIISYTISLPDQEPNTDTPNKYCSP
jgi:magnesium-transporting ATPase (P-type)